MVKAVQSQLCCRPITDCLSVRSPRWFAIGGFSNAPLATRLHKAKSIEFLATTNHWSAKFPREGWQIASKSTRVPCFLGLCCIFANSCDGIKNAGKTVRNRWPRVSRHQATKGTDSGLKIASEENKPSLRGIPTATQNNMRRTHCRAPRNRVVCWEHRKTDELMGWPGSRAAGQPSSDQVLICRLKVFRWAAAEIPPA
jgi:hypothetical protein